MAVLESFAVTRRRVPELPYAGFNRIRFQGYFSAPSGTPSWSHTVTNGHRLCKKILAKTIINHMFYINNKALSRSADCHGLPNAVPLAAFANIGWQIMQQLDIEQARFNMIEQQVRPWDVLDAQVLATMQAVPREAFVPGSCRSLAFADTNIPLGHGQVMMTPCVEGRLLQALAINSTDSILEIGTGSGYLTACLARLGRHVTSIEIYPDLHEVASGCLSAQGVGNVGLKVGDAFADLDTSEHFDAIAVTGSLPLLTGEFQQLLATGGRMFVITGSLPVMQAVLVTRSGENHWTRETLFETCIPPLLNATAPETFRF